MVLLYTVSTLYHALGVNRAKVVFRSLDHCTIFLLIAGTYTPITLVCLGGWKGWAMFGVVWAAAVVGVVLNAISVERFKKISMACYLAMGWVVVLAMGDFYRAASPLTFWCLLGGGILYTPVSYTHLDVYKRQAPAPYAPPPNALVPEEASLYTEEFALPPQDQAYGPYEDEVYQEEDYGCLLYTSRCV